MNDIISRSEKNKSSSCLSSADRVNRIKLSFHGQVQSKCDLMKAFTQMQLKATAASEKEIKKVTKKPLGYFPTVQVKVRLPDAFS